MKALEKAYEFEIAEMQRDLKNLYRKSFEHNIDIQRFVQDAESCENYNEIILNEINGVDYLYDLNEYIDMESFTTFKLECLVDYFSNLSIEVDEYEKVASTSSADEIFFNWSENVVNYSPTSEIFNYETEFLGFVWANYKCEEHGIYGGFFDVEVHDNSVTVNDYHKRFYKFWNLIKSYDSDKIKRILMHVLDNELDYEDATFYVVCEIL